jgi:CRISPR/Cas system-associated exonuclease Cas4 (RecB family)
LEKLAEGYVMTEIVRDPVYEEMFRAELQRDTRFRSKPKINRSDLLYCLRKAYYRLMSIEPSEHSSLEFTVIGKTLHGIIERNFKYKEEEMEKDGISGTVDILMLLQDKQFPIEIKTTRKTIVVAADIPTSYIEQLKMAMIMLNVNEGLLAILNVITAELQVWVIRITEEEKWRFWQEILRRRNLVELAAKIKDVLILPRMYWMCPRCEYRSLCDKLEAEARQKVVNSEKASSPRTS